MNENPFGKNPSREKIPNLKVEKVSQDLIARIESSIQNPATKDTLISMVRAAVIGQDDKLDFISETLTGLRDYVDQTGSSEVAELLEEWGTETRGKSEI